MGNFHLQKCFLLSLCGPDNNFLLETKLLGWPQHDLLWKGPGNRQTSNMGQENFAYGGLFCAVRSTTWLSGSIMSLHTCRIHILLDAAVRCMLLHMRLLGVNYVLNDPCCFSSVMSSLTCFSESVEVHPLAPSHAGEPSGFTVWLIMSNGAAGAACLPPLQGGNFLICQYWLDFCNARQLGGLFCRCFILACCMLSDSLVSHML